MRIKPKQKIFVFSVDFDGCISPDSGSRDLKIDQLLEMMAKKLCADPDAVIILIDGSYRQSIELDQHNFKRNQNGSCFQGLEKLLASFATKFPDLKDRVSLDRFTLEDIENKKESGYHFNQAMAFLNKYAESDYLSAKTKTDLSSWHDPEKRAQVYAQMQHIACEFPESAIFFEQIDDLFEKILLPCNKFYSEYRFLIPENITYTQSQWVSGEPHPNTTEKIKGAGWVDFDYRLNAKLISSAAFDKWKFTNTIAQSQQLNLNVPAALFHPKEELRFFSLLIDLLGWPHAEKIFETTQDTLIKFRYQLTLLEIAIEKNNKEMIAKFYTPEVDIEIATRTRKWIALEWLIDKNPVDKSHYPYALYQAICSNQIALAEKLISQMTPEMRVSHTEGNQRTVLQFAILQKNYNLLEKLLSGVTEPNEKFEHACEHAFKYAESRHDQTAMDLLSPHFIHDEVFESSFTI